MCKNQIYICVICVCVEDERADAAQDGRAHLARLNFQARTETGKK